MEALRSLDFHRKVPRDVTEATTTGGCLSVFAAVFAAWLLAAQLGDYFSVRTTTSLHLDVADAFRSYGAGAAAARGGHGEAVEEPHTHPLLVSFNITFPHIPCSVLALDVADHRGLRRCALGARARRCVRARAPRVPTRSALRTSRLAPAAATTGSATSFACALTRPAPRLAYTPRRACVRAR